MAATATIRMNHARWANLTRDLFPSVSQFLPLQSVAVSRSVCSNWGKCFDHPQIWKACAQKYVLTGSVAEITDGVFEDEIGLAKVAMIVHPCGTLQEIPAETAYENGTTPACAACEEDTHPVSEWRLRLKHMVLERKLSKAVREASDAVEALDEGSNSALRMLRGSFVMYPFPIEKPLPLSAAVVNDWLEERLCDESEWSAGEGWDLIEAFRERAGDPPEEKDMPEEYHNLVRLLQSAGDVCGSCTSDVACDNNLDVVWALTPDGGLAGLYGFHQY